MRLSNFFLSTLREAPADADIVSQKLMLRAGMIKKLAAGIYNYMPMGLRSIRKIETIIREEMNAAGGGGAADAGGPASRVVDGNRALAEIRRRS